MRRVVAGILIGLVVGMVAPVSAGDAKLERKIRRLEVALNVLESSVANRLTAMQGDIDLLNGRLGVAENRTQQLASDGSYLGPVQGHQVQGKISANQVRVKLGCDDQPTKWVGLWYIDGDDTLGC